LFDKGFGEPGQYQNITINSITIINKYYKYYCIQEGRKNLALELAPAARPAAECHENLVQLPKILYIDLTEGLGALMQMAGDNPFGIRPQLRLPVILFRD